MTIWARLDDSNNVIELHENDISDVYGDSAKEVPSSLEDIVSNNGKFSYDSDNSVFTTTDLSEAKSILKTHVSDLRYIYETGGMIDPDDSTKTILTDRLSQTAVQGAALWLQANNSATVSFKNHSGWEDLSYADSVTLKNKVLKHVQDCFTREKAIVDIIDAASSLSALGTNYSDAINTGWPSTSFHKSKVDANTDFELSFTKLPGAE